MFCGWRSYAYTAGTYMYITNEIVVYRCVKLKIKSKCMKITPTLIVVEEIVDISSVVGIEEWGGVESGIRILKESEGFRR